MTNATQKELDDINSSWCSLIAVMMRLFKTQSITITVEDIGATPEGSLVVVSYEQNKVVFSLVDSMASAKQVSDQLRNGAQSH
jgi:hypothetical protein